MSNIHKNIGFIGISSHMEEHLIPSTRLVTGLNIRRMSSRNSTTRAKLKSIFEVELDADWKMTVENENIDAIIVAGPPELNYEVIDFCIEAQKPVFSEKPCAGSFEAVKALAQKERENKSIIQIGYNFRFSRMYENILSLCETHGKIIHITINFATNKPRSPLWNFDTTFESFLYAIAIHPIEIASTILGEKTTFSSNVSFVNDTSFLLNLLVHDEQTTVMLNMSNMTNCFKFEVKAVYEDGSHAAGSHSTPSEVIWFSPNFDPLPQHFPKFPTNKTLFKFQKANLNRDREGSGYQAELLEFKDLLCGGGHSKAPISQSLRPHLWLQKILDGASK